MQIVTSYKCQILFSGKKYDKVLPTENFTQSAKS